MKEPRVCWSCKYIVYEQASPGYSELTPGDDFSLCCGKDHWYLDQYRDGLEDFRRKLETAETCEDFEPRL